MTRQSKIRGLYGIRLSELDSFEKEVLMALDEMGCAPEKVIHSPEEEKVDTRPYFIRFHEQTFILEYHMQYHNFILRLPSINYKAASDLPLLTLVSNEVSRYLTTEKAVLWPCGPYSSYTLDVVTAICNDGYSDLEEMLLSKIASLEKAQEMVRELYDKYRDCYGTDDPWSVRDSILCERMMRIQHQNSDDIDRNEEDKSIPMHFKETEARAGSAKKPAEEGRHYYMDDVVGFSPLIQQLLPAVAPTWRVERIAYMKILCDEYTYVDDREDIMYQPILAPMVEGRGSNTKVRMEDCTYILGDYSGDTLVMHIQYNGENKRRIIFRLDVLHDEPSPSQRPHNPGRTTSQSMMICIDKAKEDQRKEEYHDMMSDVQDKIKARQEQNLTMAQRISTLSLDDEVKELLYVGTNAFLSRCYVQALIPLMCAYRKLDGAFDDMNRHRFENFKECLYMIGYCLDELGQFERAHYYLSQIPMWSSTKYEEERLYCFQHLGDHMLISHLLDMRSSYLEHYNWEPEDMGEDQNNFYVILMHLLTDAYIDSRKYKEAEEMLQAEIRHERFRDNAKGLLLRVRDERKNSFKSEKRFDGTTR